MVNFKKTKYYYLGIAIDSFYTHDVKKKQLD